MITEGYTRRCGEKQSGKNLTNSFARTVLCALVGISSLLLSAIDAWAWDEGFNFRATSGYVTDGTNETYVNGDSYPTTRAGVTFGFTTLGADPLRDRNSALDRRLAGIQQQANTSGNQSTFRVDLPSAGNYYVCMALGDANSAQGYQYAEVRDTSTVKITIDKNTGTSGGEFYDATGTKYSSANWPGSSTCVLVAFSTTIANLVYGTPTGQAGASTIAHLRIYSASTDTICGIDDDGDGDPYTNPCPAPDSDRDGQATDGTGPVAGKDCDDTKKLIGSFNGGRYTATSCAANQYKECLVTGSFGSCTNLSSFTGPTGTLQTYWISTSGSNSNPGTYASPWADYRCVTDSSLGCYHAPIAGDTIIFRTGSYNATWGSSPVRQLYLNNRDGTATNPITFMAAPGESVTIAGAGTSPNAVGPMWFENSDYIKVLSINVNGGYANQGIYFNGGSNPEYAGASVYNIDGSAPQNTSGVKVSAGGDNANIHHIRAYANYDRASPTAENNYAGAVLFDIADFTVTDNEFFQDSANGCHLAANKHALTGGTGRGTWKRNVMYNGACAAIVNEQPNVVIANNYFEKLGQVGGGAAVQLRSLGLAPYYDNMEVGYNTFNKTAAIELINSNNTIGATNVANIHHNIFLDDRATAYPSDGQDNIIRVATYGPNAQYSSVVSKILLSSNDYYNTAGTTLQWDLYSATSGGWGPGGNYGQVYAGLTAWKAATRSDTAAALGYDANSLNIDPAFNGDQIATAVGTTTMGWNNNYYVTPVTPPSAGTTRGGIIYHLLRGRRR